MQRLCKNSHFTYWHEENKPNGNKTDSLMNFNDLLFIRWPGSKWGPLWLLWFVCVCGTCTTNIDSGVQHNLTQLKATKANSSCECGLNIFYSCSCAVHIRRHSIINTDEPLSVCVWVCACVCVSGCTMYIWSNAIEWVNDIPQILVKNQVKFLCNLVNILYYIFEINFKRDWHILFSWFLIHLNFSASLVVH